MWLTCWAGFFCKHDRRTGSVVGRDPCNWDGRGGEAGTGSAAREERRVVLFVNVEKVTLRRDWPASRRFRPVPWRWGLRTSNIYQGAVAAFLRRAWVEAVHFRGGFMSSKTQRPFLRGVRLLGARKTAPFGLLPGDRWWRSYASRGTPDGGTSTFTLTLAPGRAVPSL